VAIIAPSSTRYRINCGTHRVFFSPYQSCFNGFQRRALHFLWVPELSQFLSHSNSRLTPQQLRLPQEDSVKTVSTLFYKVACNSTLSKKKSVTLRPTVSRPVRLGVRREHFHFHDFGWLLLVACMILLCNHKRTEFGKPHAYREPMCASENCQWLTLSNNSSRL
jgi:hypothetical protein